MVETKLGLRVRVSMLLAMCNRSDLWLYYYYSTTTTKPFEGFCFFFRVCDFDVVGLLLDKDKIILFKIF